MDHYTLFQEYLQVDHQIDEFYHTLAQALGLEAGDDMELYTPRGTIVVKAKPSHRVQKGVVFFYHGYSEADVNSLMDKDHVDPYSGFPAYNATRCGMRKKAQP